MTDAAWCQIRRHARQRRLFLRSRTKIADITDGTANTYLAGEKYVDPDHYDDGTPPNNDQGGHAASTGTPCDGAVVTTTGPPAKCAGNINYLPAQDMPGVRGRQFRQRRTRSASTWRFCDGSVHAINYSIDLETFHRLGEPRGKVSPVDAKKY